MVPAVRPWFEHDVSGRKGSLPALMRLVRWPLLPAGMRQNLPNEPLFDHLITLDKETRSLGLRMMLECGARNSQGGVLAFDCPRSKRRIARSCCYASAASRHVTTGPAMKARRSRRTQRMWGAAWQCADRTL